LADRYLVLNATGRSPDYALKTCLAGDCLDQLEFFVRVPAAGEGRAPGMKQRRAGRIIMIGSEVFEVGVPAFANYVAAKGASWV